jgi:hypothetical protein
MSSTLAKPVGMFFVVSASFSFSLEEVSGFSTPAWASRQKGILAPFNPRVFGIVSNSRGTHCETPLCASCTGFIPEVVVSHANSSRTERFVATCQPECQVPSQREKSLRTGKASIVGVARSQPLPRGRRGTEPLSRTILVASATGGMCRRGLFSLGMRLFSDPGVVETLNATDEGSFGKGRNTYETYS